MPIKPEVVKPEPKVVKPVAAIFTATASTRIDQLIGGWIGTNIVWNMLIWTLIPVDGVSLDDQS